MRAILPTMIALALLAGFEAPALAQAQTQAQADCPATETMRGGRNNYRAEVPLVDNLGIGWTASGTVREAGSCAPLAGVTVKLWSATDRGGERDPSNHGATLTDAEGRYVMPFSEIRPMGGQLHIHIAVDQPEYEPLFLRPVLAPGDTEGMVVDFVLKPTGRNAS